METFSALLALYAVNSSIISEYPAKRPMMRSFHIFADLRLNKRLSNNKNACDMMRHRAHCGQGYRQPIAGV